MSYEFFNQTGNGTDYIQATASLFSYPFTINFWFYPTVSAVGTLQIFVLHNTTDNQRFAVQINTSTTRLQFNAFTTANANAVANASYTVNAWNMATAVGTSSTSRTVYINGGNAGTNTTLRAVTTPTRWLVAANYAGTPSPTYEGRISEVGIWNAALTTADINSLYTGVRSSSVKPQNLKVYAPLIRDISDQTSSTTSFSNTLTDTTVAVHSRRYG
jgi:hypothetical protein